MTRTAVDIDDNDTVQTYLHQALNADTPHEKDFHIRHALQLAATDSPPQTTD